MKSVLRNGFYVSKKYGFTLVELLVVISILAILAAALTTQVSKAKLVGQSIRCKSNLKNLAQVALTCEGIFPIAGSYEIETQVLEKNGSNGSEAWVPKYGQYVGWVSWTYSGTPWPSDKPQGENTKPASFYGTDSLFSITNGVLWAQVGKDLSGYLCDVHKGAAKRAGLDNVRRSYVMNSFFGYNCKIAVALIPNRRYISVQSLWGNGVASRVLLFAELPAFTLQGNQFVEQINSGVAASDGVLEAEIKGYNDGVDDRPSVSAEEIIGFNHQIGKRFTGHCAFADGHVEVIVAPTSPSDQKLRDLTYLLCNGLDIPADEDAWVTARNDYENGN